MTQEQILQRLRSTLDAPLPLPGAGQTAIRHERLMEIGRENLSLARLAEAHWDAAAILAEPGRAPVTGALYGVWASEIPGQSLEIERGANGLTIHGAKLFCSGAGLIDHALVTTGTPNPLLVDIDLRANSHAIEFDDSIWKTTAFQETRTSKGVFHRARVPKSDIVGKPGWYLARPGFWHGACGPAACWAGGARGLLTMPCDRVALILIHWHTWGPCTLRFGRCDLVWKLPPARSMRSRLTPYLPASARLPYAMWLKTPVPRYYGGFFGPTVLIPWLRIQRSPAGTRNLICICDNRMPNAI